MFKRTSAAALLLLVSALGSPTSPVEIDVTAFGDRSSQSNTISTSVFSTNVAGELLLAFVSADSTGSPVQVNSVSGAGLTWVLVVRANAQLGTAEIWRAFAAATLSSVSVTATLSQNVAASITVVTFTGVDSSGTNGSGAIGAVASAAGATGAPRATLVTTRANSWVFGVGTDWDGATGRTLGPNQTMVHQYFATVGDTYWVQRQNAVTPEQGTSVTINDTAPTNHRWDLSIVEIVPASGVSSTLSGTITPADDGSGALVTLGGGASQTTTADSSGNYSFTGLGSGVYTVTPSKSGFQFTPPQRTVTIATADQTAVAFTAAPATGNPIVIENSSAGTSSWQPADQAYFGEIEGYAGATSVNRGGAIALYVNSNGAAFTLDVYRFGWYQGLGARLMMSAGTLPGQAQPACPQDPNFGLIACAWTPTLTVNVDPTWTTGVYMAKMRRLDTGQDNYLTFVVRDDASTSEILFDSNVNTMQAYNAWGGKALYAGLSSAGRPAKSIHNAAVKVSFDRPYQPYDFYAGTNGEDTQFLRWEYQMVRWLESQGFDVSYSTNVDTGSTGAVLQQHRVYLSAGHSEYWPSSMRNNIEAALNGGVSLAFFTANTGYWQVRFEASTSGVPNRVMVAYKESAVTYDPLLNDPAQSTTLFRSQYIQRPENALLGTMWGDATGTTAGFPFVVSNSAHPFYRHTGLMNGNSMPGLVGTEWDNTSGLPTSNMPPNVPGLIVLSNSPTSSSNANAVVHQMPTGALVFAVGTLQWSWGLDTTLTPIIALDPRVGQITANILIDMGAAPQTPVSITVSRTFSIAGHVSSTSGAATVTLSGAASRITTTDAQGNYVFKVVPTGVYTVTPTESGGSFTPASRSITVSDADVTNVDFTTGIPTYSMAGTIMGPLGASVQVTLSGAATASTTTNVAGAFTFNGLANGVYSLTPIKSGTLFTPTSRSVTINNTDLTDLDFTAALAFTISGTITPAASGANSTVQLSGAASATTTTDSSGNYTLTNVADGQYTVTPSKAGFALLPPSQPVLVDGATVTGVNFTAQPATGSGLTIDVVKWKDRSSASTSIAAPAFSVAFADELLLAFISADSRGTTVQVNNVTGGSLTWVLVGRANAELGTAEIWRAFTATPRTNITVTASLSQSVAASITVVTFLGADTSGTNGSGAIGAVVSRSAPSGAPTASLVTTRDNSWVFGAGTDWDGATARTLGPAQTMVHQYLATIGDTYWLQRQTNPTPVAGATVTINDTAPTTHRYDLIACEILPRP